MGIEYPDGIDTFNVPSDPEATPLSEAGSSTRNHVELHRDTANAVTALEITASFKDHDHSGDGTTQHGNKLVQANTHQSADTDSGTSSIHHTLGTMPHQAAPGDHVHDYEGSTITNKPLVLCTSTTRPPWPYLGLQLWESDTNRARVWAQFQASDVANVGVLWTDHFNRTSTTTLGTDWDQSYFPIDPTVNPTGKAGGVMATPDGANVQWVYDYLGGPYGTGGKYQDQEWPPPGWPWPYVQGRCIARNVKNSAQHTNTDDQSLSWVAGPGTMQFNYNWPPSPSTNDFYLRMSDDEQSYIRVAYTYTPGIMYSLWLITSLGVTPRAPGSTSIMVYSTTSGIAGEELINQLTVPHSDPWSTYQIDLIGRTLTFYIDSQFVGTITDRNEVSLKGSSNRGWGFGMTVGRDPSWTQTVRCHPTYVHSLTMRDVVYYTGAPIWQLLAVGSIPVLQLRQGHVQRIAHAGSLLEWDLVDEDNFQFFNVQNSMTDIVISETGFYHFDCVLQWGTHYYPDAGTIVLMRNGTETVIRQNVSAYGQTHQATMGAGGKGSGSKGAHYSLSIPLSGKIRLTAGDILQVQVYYTSSSTIWDLMESYSDAPANVVSRCNLHFVSP